MNQKTGSNAWVLGLFVYVKTEKNAHIITFQT